MYSQVPLYPGLDALQIQHTYSTDVRCIKVTEAEKESVSIKAPLKTNQSFPVSQRGAGGRRHITKQIKPQSTILISTTPANALLAAYDTNQLNHADWITSLAFSVYERGTAGRVIMQCDPSSSSLVLVCFRPIWSVLLTTMDA